MAHIVWHYIDAPQESVMVFVGGDRKTVMADNEHFEAILAACESGDIDTVTELVDKATMIAVRSNNLFKVIDGVVHVLHEGSYHECPDALSSRIIKFTQRGLDVTPLVRFYQRLLGNPSFRALESLYRYLESNSTPIVSAEVNGMDYTGCFVAWKSVKHDFTDHHTGKFDNSPGNTVTMPRNQVNEDPNETCSDGLHVAAWEYAWGFNGGRKLKVFVDPADVVAVPHDYKNQKMRVCKYVVIEEVENASRVNEEENRLVESRAHALSSLEEDEDEDDDFYDCDCDEDDDEDNSTY